MKFSVAAFAALLATTVFAQTPSDPAVNTPVGVVVCQPASITVSGTHPPFILSVIPANQVGAAAIETLGTLAAAGAFTWNVNLAAGTAITFQVKDATGVLGYSAAVTIQAGTSTSCVGAPASGSAAPGTTPGTAPPATTGAATSSAPLSVPPASTPAPATTPATTPAAVTTHPTTTTHATSPAASPSATSNAASVAGVKWGAAVLSGAVAVAILA